MIAAAIMNAVDGAFGNVTIGQTTAACAIGVVVFVSGFIAIGARLRRSTRV
ncbi:MAG: hypothetical protein QM651_02245 [Rhodoblastus sp.]